MIKKEIIAEFVPELQVVIFIIVIFFFFLCTGKTGIDLGFYENVNVDLDIFLYNACEILGGWTTGNKWCSFNQKFEYALGLFSAFCSDFIGIYLNLTISFVEDLLCRVALNDKSKILNVILKHAGTVLVKFFDLFDQVNKSVCYENHKVKQKFAPYYATQSTL